MSFTKILRQNVTEQKKFWMPPKFCHDSHQSRTSWISLWWYTNSMKYFDCHHLRVFVVGQQVVISWYCLTVTEVSRLVITSLWIVHVGHTLPHDVRWRSHATSQHTFDKSKKIRFAIRHFQKKINHWPFVSGYICPEPPSFDLPTPYFAGILNLNSVPGSGPGIES